MPNAIRHNSGKPELHYTDMFPAAVSGVAQTLEYGTRRAVNPYPRYNWCDGAPYLELYNCARRHMMKWLNGEEQDPDAKANGFDISHLDFAIGNLMRLRQQIANGRTDLDDRYKVPIVAAEGTTFEDLGHGLVMQTYPNDAPPYRVSGDDTRTLPVSNLPADKDELIRQFHAMIEICYP